MADGALIQQLLSEITELRRRVNQLESQERKPGHSEPLVTGSSGEFVYDGSGNLIMVDVYRKLAVK